MEVTIVTKTGIPHPYNEYQIYFGTLNPSSMPGLSLIELPARRGGRICLNVDQTSKDIALSQLIADKYENCMAIPTAKQQFGYRLYESGCHSLAIVTVIL